MPVRMAALIAVDAPPAFYLANAGAAADSRVTAGNSSNRRITAFGCVGQDNRDYE
jgi:hypothetical protein